MDDLLNRAIDLYEEKWDEMDEEEEVTPKISKLGKVVATVDLVREEIFDVAKVIQQTNESFPFPMRSSSSKVNLVFNNFFPRTNFYMYVFL